MSSSTLSTSALVCQLRGRLGLTQEKLAERLGVRFQTVNRWERGHAQPSPLAMAALKRELQEMGDKGTDLMDGYLALPYLLC